MDEKDIKTEETVSELCNDIQKKLDELSKQGYCGMLMITAPSGRPFLAQAGDAGELLRMVGHTAVPSLVYEDSCSKEKAGSFLRDVTSTITEHLEEE